MRAIFLGGDYRQKYACDFLNKQNIQSEYFENIIFDEKMKKIIGNANIICLPIPSVKNEIYLNTPCEAPVSIKDIISCSNIDTKFYGAQFTESIRSCFQLSNIQFFDYMNDELFQIQNALLTAEGAIHYAKQRIDKSIYGLDTVIFGFGRIGKILTYLLHSQGARVTVCARKQSDYAWCQLAGINGVKIKNTNNIYELNLINNKYDLIINTIPYWIMQEEFVKNIDSKTQIIDLASFPFGVDELLVKKYNLNYYRELGIPGRYSPLSAGEILGNTIINNL